MKTVRTRDGWPRSTRPIYCAQTNIEGSFKDHRTEHGVRTLAVLGMPDRGGPSRRTLEGVGESRGLKGGAGMSLEQWRKVQMDYAGANDKGLAAQ